MGDINYVEKFVEDEKFIDLENEFRRKFKDDNLRLIVKGSKLGIRLIVHDTNLKLVAVADAFSFGITILDLHSLGIEDNEISNESLDANKLKKFWLNFLNKNYDAFRDDYIIHEIEKAKGMLSD